MRFVHLGDRNVEARYRGAMRWEMLFADLEARLAAAERSEVDAEIAERARDERAAVDLAARLAAARGAAVTLVLRGGSRVTGTVADAAGTWVLLEASASDALVPLAAVVAAEGLGHRAAPLGAVERRIGITSALRGLAQARAHVAVETEGGQWQGRIVAVAADHLDLDGFGGPRAVRLAALLVVRARA